MWVLGPIREHRWRSWHLIWQRYFLQNLCNSWTEFQETGQKARNQRHLPHLCFRADSSLKMTTLTSDWLKIFFFSEINEQNLTRQETSNQRPLPGVFRVNSLTKITILVSDFRDVFNIYCAAAERNSTKLDRKQVLKALYNFKGTLNLLNSRWEQSGI